MKIIPVKYLKSRVCNLSFAGSILTVLGIVMACYGFPKIIKNHIAENVALKNGTEGFEMWKDMPMPLTFKVYLFNVTNVEEMMEGAKPKLKEIGPYVYDQHRIKRNIEYPGNDTISYEMKKIFTFNKEASFPLLESDVVTILNVPMMGIIITAYKIFPQALSIVNQLLPELFKDLQDPFMRVSVGDLLFKGILINCNSTNSLVESACEELKSRKLPTMREDDSEGFYFSMFNHINDTFDGPFVVSSGVLNPELLGNTVSYKNNSELKEWTGDCKILKGTDTTIFAPMDDSNFPKAIYIYQPDACRVMYAEFKAKKTIFNLQSFRYETTKRVLGSYKTNEENKCFCPKRWSLIRDGCALDGLQTLEPCQGVSVIASFPHFYLADPILREYIAEGINPNKEKHGTFVHIEPRTGAALKGAKRLQFNMELLQFSDITVLNNVLPGLFPILWIEEGAEINDNLKKLLGAVHEKIIFLKVFQWIIVAIGIILLLAAFHYRRKGLSDRWSWTPNKVDLGTPENNSESHRPGAAMKDGRFQGFSNQAFTLTESIAHR